MNRAKKYLSLFAASMACLLPGCGQKDETIDKAPPPGPNARPAPQAAGPKTIPGLQRSMSTPAAPTARRQAITQ